MFVHQEMLVFKLDQGEPNLPPRCIKSGEPASEQEPLEIGYVPQWVVATVLVGVVFCSLTAVLLLIFRKRVRFAVGLSPEWLAYRRRWRSWARWLGAASLLLLVAGGVLWAINRGPGYPRAMGWSLCLTAGFGLAASAYGFYRGNLLYAKEVRNGWVRLAGVHPEFLAQLPPWPKEW